MGKQDFIINKMVVRTFKDIKRILNTVPDEILEYLAFGVGEGSEETVRVIAYTDEYFELFDKIDKEYPELNEVFNLIENIREAQKILDEQEDSEFVEDLAEGGLTPRFITGEDELGNIIKEKLRKERGRKKAIKIVTSKTSKK